MVASLLNQAIEARGNENMFHLLTYVLAMSAGKIKNRFSSKYFEILQGITDEMFDNDSKAQIPALTEGERKGINFIIRRLPKPHDFEALQDQIVSGRQPDINTLKDVSKLLVYTITAIQASTSEVYALMLPQSPGPTKDVLKLAITRLIRIIVPLETLAFGGITSFIISDILGQKIDIITKAIDTKRAEELEKSIASVKVAKEAKMRVARETEAREAAARKAKQIAQLSKLPMEKRAAIEASLAQSASDPFDSGEDDLSDGENRKDEETLDDDESDMPPLDTDHDISPVPTCNPQSSSSVLVAWIRVMASSVHYGYSFNKRSSSFKQIAFDVINYAKSPRTLIDWKSSIQELVGNKAPAVIAGLEKLDPRFARGSKIRFPGRVHCEAFVAAMHLLSKKRFAHSVSQSIPCTPQVPPDY